MATCVDVAKKAKVSRATVTRVIREPEKVNEDTRKRVLQVMEELNYSSNLFASSLKSSKSNMVGLIIPDIVNPFYIEFAYKLQRKLFQNQYNLIIQLSNEDIQEEYNGIQFLSRCKVESLLVSPSEVNPKIIDKKDYFSDNIIQIFRNTYDCFSGIYVTDEVGAYIAAKELIEYGHKDIVLLERISKNIESSRLKGVIKACEENSIYYDLDNYYPIDIDNFSLDDMINIISQNKGKCFIVVAYQLQELFINALSSLKLSLKNDISAVFYDKTFFSKTYNTTTIAHNIDEIVDNVIEYIFNHSKLKSLVKIPLTPYLIKGESINKR